MTLRKYIEDIIAQGSVSDIGERRWNAERLQKLLKDYDAGEPSLYVPEAISMEVTRLGGRTCG